MQTDGLQSVIVTMKCTYMLSGPDKIDNECKHQVDVLNKVFIMEVNVLWPIIILHNAKDCVCEKIQKQRQTVLC